MIRGRALFGAVPLLLLAACSSSGGADYSQFIQILRQSWAQSFGPGAVPLAEAAKIPYASMGWRLNGGQESLIVLATDNAGEQLWTSATHVVLLTRGGQIARSVGLPRNIAQLSPQRGGALVPPAQALQGPYTDRRSADFPDIGIYAAEITCHGKTVANQTITILGKSLRTARVEETCESPALDWNFTNRFWIDRESGMVWQTDQEIHPGKVRIQTEIFRPPG